MLLPAPQDLPARCLSTRSQNPAGLRKASLCRLLLGGSWYVVGSLPYLPAADTVLHMELPLKDCFLSSLGFYYWSTTYPQHNFIWEIPLAFKVRNASIMLHSYSFSLWSLCLHWIFTLSTPFNNVFHNSLRPNLGCLSWRFCLLSLQCLLCFSDSKYKSLASPMAEIKEWHDSSMTIYSPPSSSTYLITVYIGLMLLEYLNPGLQEMLN